MWLGGSTWAHILLPAAANPACNNNNGCRPARIWIKKKGKGLGSQVAAWEASGDAVIEGSACGRGIEERKNRAEYRRIEVRSFVLQLQGVGYFAWYRRLAVGITGTDENQR